MRNVETFFTFVVGSLIVGVLYYRARKAEGKGVPDLKQPNIKLEELSPGVTDVPHDWQYPPQAAPYVLSIDAAEGRNSIPPRLLGRLLYEESRYRADIIDGSTVSSAGAVGIAQIVPYYHPTVDPLDPYASIEYAARYLASLKRQFGSWDKALAAYNWGPGNSRSD